MIKETKNLKLTGKDLITIGIFSAIYFVINFIFMILGIVPILWILMPGLIALFSGIPFMILSIKVSKPGAVLLMGIITAVIYFITGQFTILILITFSTGCLLSEFVRWITKYTSFRGNVISYIFFSLGMIGSPLPLWIFRDSFITQITEQGMPETYITSIQALASSEMLVVLIIAPVIGAVVGSLITKKMFKKHFVKAGIM